MATPLNHSAAEGSCQRALSATVTLTLKGGLKLELLAFMGPRMVGLIAGVSSAQIGLSNLVGGFYLCRVFFFFFFTLQSLLWVVIVDSVLLSHPSTLSLFDSLLSLFNRDSFLLLSSHSLCLIFMGCVYISRGCCDL